MSKKVVEWSRPLRWWMIRQLSPTVWYNSRQHSLGEHEQRFITMVPRGSTLYAKELFKDREVVCCEIGVASAENSESILKTLNVERLYLVDPYTPYHIPHAFVPKTVPQDKQDMRVLLARERLNRWEDKCVWLTMSSEEASDLIPDNSLDFLYIDGDHSLKAFNRDLDLYYPKVKTGGVMSGHDFSGDWLPIVYSVVAFTVKHGLKLETRQVDWWFVKK